MDRKTNINNPAQFIEKLQEVMSGVYELLDLAREHDLKPVNDNGVIVYSENYGKSCFQVARQFDRPSESLQALLDIIRVNFEPCVLGTMFLNSNMDFLNDQVPDAPFQLGYASLTSEPNQGFDAFWDERVCPHLLECGYVLGDASAVYAVASTGTERYGYRDFLHDILSRLGAGFSVAGASELLASTISKTVAKPRHTVHAGFCLDSALGSRIRVSLWLFT